MTRLWILLAFVACRSDSARYYTLVASPADSPAPATNEIQLDVLPVDVPADVDRAEIVVRDSDGEVTPVDTRAWIAPLAREIRHAFSDNLTRDLGARDIADVTPADGVPIIRIKLAVQRFESLLNKKAVIEAISTVRDSATDKPPLVCSHRASEDAKSGYNGLAEAHQRALATIAKQVADGVKSLRAGAPACAK